MVFVNAGGGYCLAIAVLALTGAIPRPANTEAWIQGWPATWWQDLGLVFSSRGVILRDALMVFLIPWIALPRPFVAWRCSSGWPCCWLSRILSAVRCGWGSSRRQRTGGLSFCCPLAWYAGLIIPSLARLHQPLVCDRKS